MDYFGKEMDQLTIRECAMLAGMVQKPYNTNPRLNIYQRTLTDAKREELEGQALCFRRHYRSTVPLLPG